jgi:hypothetical protein
MTIQLIAVDDFLAMMEPGAAKAALEEKQAVRSHIYNSSFMQAVENGMDESVVLLYAQCALDEFDKGNIQ